MQRRYIQIKKKNQKTYILYFLSKEEVNQVHRLAPGVSTPRVHLLQQALLSSYENPHCSCLRTQIAHTLAVASPLCQGKVLPGSEGASSTHGSLREPSAW